jgi:hypothetical protein
MVVKLCNKFKVKVVIHSLECTLSGCGTKALWEIYWFMLNINGMTAPLKKCVFFFMYGNDVVYCYSLTMLMNE